jgi:hypothetical protein
MSKIKFEEFFLLLNEWKDIVDGNGTDHSAKENTKLKIEKLLKSLRSQKTKGILIQLNVLLRN